MTPTLRFLLLSLVLALAPAWAQPPDPPPASEAGPQTQPMAESDMQGMDRMPMGNMGSSDSMKSMAESMKAMADMCREMMQREMAMMPAKMAAYALFGLLLLTVLVLLIVLQVQWIKYWSRLLKSQRST